MEFLIELVFELLFDSAEEIAKNPKMPKPLRIASAVVVIAVTLFVVLIIAVVGVAIFTEHPVGGIVFLLLDAVFIILIIRKIIRVKNKR